MERRGDASKNQLSVQLLNLGILLSPCIPPPHHYHYIRPLPLYTPLLSRWGGIDASKNQLSVQLLELENLLIYSPLYTPPPITTTIYAPSPCIRPCCLDGEV